MENTLLIFIKNPQLGKVKTRLAATVGNDEALRIYKILLEMTRRAALDLAARRWLFYADFLEKRDGWRATDFSKKLQIGHDLGQRMENAFREAFEKGAKRVVIIGSDCPEISPEILRQAFLFLENGSEVVVGPAPDGGYYLLGLGSFFPEIFRNIEWSTDTVFSRTLKIAADFGKKTALLPVLSDVDTENDWVCFLEKQNLITQKE